MPILMCDFCGKRIEDARMAMEINDSSQALEDGEMSNIFHVHKGVCDRSLEEKLGGSTGSTELIDHIFMLAYNVGMRQPDFETFEERRQIWDQLP